MKKLNWLIMKSLSILSHKMNLLKPECKGWVLHTNQSGFPIIRTEWRWSNTSGLFLFISEDFEAGLCSLIQMNKVQFFFFCLSIRFPVHIFVYRGLFLSRRRRWRAVCSLWFTHSLHLAEWVTWQYPLEEKAEFRTSVEECLLYILECNWPDTVYLII